MGNACYSVAHRYVMIWDPFRQAYSKYFIAAGMQADFHVMAITVMTDTIKMS